MVDAELAQRGIVSARALEAWSLSLPTADCDIVFDAALAAGVRVQRVEPVRSTLEDAFMKTLSAEEVEPS